MTSYFVITLIVLILLGFAARHIFRRRPKTLNSLLVAYDEVVDKDNAAIITQKDTNLIDWPEISASFADRRIRAVVLAHGTFAGNDPWSLLSALPFGNEDENSDPSKFKKWSKGLSDKIYENFGKFTDEYKQSLASEIGQKTEVNLFHWSGENHHIARLIAASELVNRALEISNNLGVLPGERILFLGHSHAGQVFALASHLMTQSPYTDELLYYIEHAGNDLPNLDQLMRTTRSVAFDFVTLGTPPRYRWSKTKLGRVMHIVNHRTDTIEGGGIGGIWHTRDGDYIQQLGIAGSDFQATDDLHKELNHELNELLGPGADPKFLKEAVTHKRRVVPDGKNLLVDFGDGARLTPNAAITLLGHSGYTQVKNMRLIFSLITEHW